MLLTIFKKIIPYFKILRVNSWVKNLLIFLPLLSAHNFNTELWINHIIIFTIFCISASSMYIINDLLDVEKDRLHLIKKNRPIASSTISKKTASFYFIFLQFFIFGTIFTTKNINLIYFIIFYYALVLFYSKFLKKIKFVDVACISVFFVFRVFMGAKLAEIETTIWITNFIFFMFFGLALLKRHSEINSNHVSDEDYNKVRPYDKDEIKVINFISLISMSMSSILLSIYFVSEKIFALYSNKEVLLIIPPMFFVFILILHNNIIKNKNIDDPINHCLKFKTTWFFVVLTISCLLLAK